MQTLKQLFRKNYSGEDIITNLTYENSKWNSESEYMPNQINNLQVSNRAVILGNGPSRSLIDLDLIKNNRAGIRGRLKLQSYGCNALYRDFAPDFLVVTGAGITEEIANSDYCDDHIVYSTIDNIVTYPNNFYIIPQDPRWNSGALATYIACFDGHKKIFLLGFDGFDSSEYYQNIYSGTAHYPDLNDHVTDEFWIETMTAVFDTYPDVEFIRVIPTENFYTPEKWRYATNFRQITTRQFVFEADL